MATIETGMPVLTFARELMERFQRMLRTRDPAGRLAQITHVTRRKTEAQTAAA
jgi:hypothetical protein